MDKDNNYSDMHLHTMQSNDGEDSTIKVLNSAVQNGIKNISIADHNNLKNTKKAINYSNKKNKYKDLNVYPGVEITCKARNVKKSVHILLYGFDLENPELNKLTERISKEEKNKKYEMMSNYETALGIKFNPYSVLKKTLSKGHLGQKDMVDLTLDTINSNLKRNEKPVKRQEVSDFISYVQNLSTKEKKDKFSIKMFPYAHLLSKEPKQPQYPNLGEVLDIAKKSGAVPVIAHPSLIKFENKSKSWDDNFSDFVNHFSNEAKKRNLQGGIECFYGRSVHDNVLAAKLIESANEHGLLISAGSDYHGSKRKHTRSVGTFFNKKIKNTTLPEYLENRKIKIKRSPTNLSYYTTVMNQNEQDYIKRNNDNFHKKVKNKNPNENKRGENKGYENPIENLKRKRKEAKKIKNQLNITKERIEIKINKAKNIIKEEGQMTPKILGEIEDLLNQYKKKYTKIKNHKYNEQFLKLNKNYINDVEEELAKLKRKSKEEKKQREM